MLKVISTPPSDSKADKMDENKSKALAAALRRQPSRIADIHDALNVQHLLCQLKQALSHAPDSVVVLNAV